MSTTKSLLRRAREIAGLTQTTLAHRAGIPQSVISEYERGRREPSVAALTTLLDAAGFTLAAIAEPDSLAHIRRHSKSLRAAFAELGATNISVVGSVARGDDRADSDVDLLVDVDETVGLVKLGRMQTAAEEILGRAVDVVPRAGLKIVVAESVAEDEVPL